MGIECKNNSDELNTLATTLLKYIKLRFNVIPDEERFKIYDDVILYDDEKDVGKEIWNRIMKEIDCKKKKQAPQPDLDNYIIFAKNKKRKEKMGKESWLYKEFEIAIEEAKNYGETERYI